MNLTVVVHLDIKSLSYDLPSAQPRRDNKNLQRIVASAGSLGPLEMLLRTTMSGMLPNLATSVTQ